jgi:hypothetical protein
MPWLPTLAYVEHLPHSDQRMSTKVTLKHRSDAPAGVGFRLYEDALDARQVGNPEDAGEPSATPVYLQLDGVAVELQTLAGGGASVTLTLPRDIARELGLVP